MLSLIRWLSHRSLGVLHALGAALGWIAFAVSASYRKRLRANAALGGAGSAQWRASVGHAGRMVAELPLLWLRPPGQPLAPAAQWQGAERIERALDAGRGLLMLSPHLGAFEVIAQAYAERFGTRQPMVALYRPARQAWLRALEETARHRPGLLTAPATLAGVRQMLRALRQGQTVGLLPDQVPPDGMGVWAPFFGERAYTMTLAAKLSQQTGAPILLLLGERLPRAQGWRIRVLDPPESLPAAAAFGGDDAAHQTECAAVMNRAMEFVIRQCPEQYLWGYHRYKHPRSA
jgi:KDO2-lipid IV(A) lauroyltransferase